MIPSPADSGWVLLEGKLSAHMTENLPASIATIEMSVCKCDQSKCVRGNCSCYRNRIKCSDSVAANTVRTLTNLCLHGTL